MPAASDVTGITARCLPFRFCGIKSGTDEFAVPPKWVPAVMRALGEPEPAEDPPRGSEEVAVLRLACRDGRSVVVRLYFFYKEPARYSVDDVHGTRSGPYVGNTDNPLMGGSPSYSADSGEIYDVFRLMAGPLDDLGRAEVAGLFADLDRSAGRLEAAAAAKPGPATGRGPR